MSKETQSIHSQYEPPCGILKTIKRFEYIPVKDPEIWGFVEMSGLLFCFRAFHALPRGSTKWYPYAPCNPLSLLSRFTDDDARFILEKLGIEPADSMSSKEKCREVFSSRKEEYDAFLRERYFKDDALRKIFGTAINLKCDEIEKNMVL